MPEFAQGGTLLATTWRVLLAIGVPLLWAIASEMVVSLFHRKKDKC